MLYVTTRSNRDAFTPHRILTQNRAADGGLYVPFRDLQFTPDEIAELSKQSFSKCVSDVLNKLFRTNLTSWDIEFAAGRYPVRLRKLGQRVIVGECWHNLEADFLRIARSITALLRKEEQSEILCGEWTLVGIRIAILFGIFSELMRSCGVNQENPIDVSVVSGDFSGPMSVWYARKWGLPIGNIVCCCNENGNVWNFICHGQLRTDGVAKITATPDADVVVPTSLERLVYSSAGVDEVLRYVDCVRRGASYYVDDKLLHSLREGIYVTVNSDRRVFSTISGAYGTHKYLMSPYSALTYAGLQDYRSRTGENRMALIISEKSPACDAHTVAAAMGLSIDKLHDLLDCV